MGVSIVLSASVVGLVAAAFTLVGMPLGNRASVLWGRRLEVFGGLMLIVIGFMCLWDHIQA
jgi:putative Mn2+ efflux pump MntP